MAVTNVVELNALVERVKKPSVNMPVSLKNKLIRSSVPPLWPPQMLESLSQNGRSRIWHGHCRRQGYQNHFASEYIYNAYKDEKTCGVLSEDDTFGTITIAEPIGIICGIVPTTNPTSTAIFKSLISLKTRNAIIFSPHPRAKDATNKAADIVLQAAIAAGAPKDLIGWIDQPSVELSNALMHHPDINLILATGGPAWLKQLIAPVNRLSA